MKAEYHDQNPDTQNQNDGYTETVTIMRGRWATAAVISTLILDCDSFSGRLLAMTELRFWRQLKVGCKMGGQMDGQMDGQRYLLMKY